MTAVILLGIIVGTILAGFWALTYGHSYLARERFTLEMIKVRNDVEFDVFSGDLPDNEAVQFLWAKADILARRPDMISLSRMVAMVEHLQRGNLNVPSTPSYNELSPEERRRAHEYEKLLSGNVAIYVIDGSRLWFLMPLINRVHLRKPEESVEVTAVRYVEILDDAKVVTDHGPRVSPSILPASRRLAV